MGETGFTKKLNEFTQRELMATCPDYVFGSVIATCPECGGQRLSTIMVTTTIIKKGDPNASGIYPEVKFLCCSKGCLNIFSASEAHKAGEVKLELEDKAAQAIKENQEGKTQ